MEIKRVRGIMSAQLKLSNINTHVVDILASVKGRDQPVMTMDKAVELVKSLEQEVFTSDEYVFFDPFCKAGEILLATALVSLLNRSDNKAFSMDSVYKDLYQSNRYFALAPDERHYNLSMRTFYGNEKSHDQGFTKNIKNGDYLSEIDGRLNEDKFKQELKAMLEYIKEKTGNKKVIAVGNPPYQEEDGGFGGSAKAIYNYFVETLMDSDSVDQFVLVIPSRWFSAGKGVDLFRKRILEFNGVQSIKHFKQSKTVFPTVDVLGGICFLYWNSVYKGDIRFQHEEETSYIKSSEKPDIILDDPLGYEIVRKVKAKWNKRFVSEIAWSGKPFGLRCYYFKRNPSLKEGDVNAIGCYSKGRKILYANKKHVTKNYNKKDEYKVAIPAAYAPGSSVGVRRVTLPVHQYFIIPKGYIASETYSVVGSFKTKKEAQNYVDYLRTDFSRYLLGLRKVTQHIPKDRWLWVPYMDVSISWTDEKLFKYFNISKKEQERIRDKVKEWS